MNLVHFLGFYVHKEDVSKFTSYFQSVSYLHLLYSKQEKHLRNDLEQCHSEAYLHLDFMLMTHT